MLDFICNTIVNLFLAMVYITWAVFLIGSAALAIHLIL